MLDTAAKKTESEVAERLIVRGLVQGVGFRPTVWRIANRLNIRGTVSNNGEGVEICAAGPRNAIDELVTCLHSEPPPLARIFEIERVAMTEFPCTDTFHIADSTASGIHTGVVPDASVCEECRAETFDPFARRFRYPFTNCTHCGPRFSIVESIPYDRSGTTMHGFDMCEECRAEYECPADRRFHAQPIACYKCGPRVWLERADGNAFTADAFTMLDETDAVCTLIQRGFIVAIKGLGGFQFACDATNEEAVSRLRSQKHRERKPFALMCRDLEAVRMYCEVSDEEEKLLTSPAAPIVILNRNFKFQISNFKVTEDTGSEISDQRPKTKDQRSKVAKSVAPGIETLGIMLPNTPLHHLILRRMDRPVVLTSGNVSDEPQATDNDDAKQRLAPIADYFVFNDRPIAQRVDDSVVKIMDGEVRVFRRARGYSPSPFILPKGFENAPEILAYGGELKNTFCLLKDGKAIVSQHIGDLEDAATQADYRHNLKLYETIYQHKPEVIVCDLHPEYISAKLARERSEPGAAATGFNGSPHLIEVQHHHAHIAACLAENRFPVDTKPVIGVALDGLGYGDDGSFWGGEFLLADYREYKRLATFKPVAMIGGEQAIKEPWRNTYAHLMAEMGWPKFAMNYAELELFGFLDSKPRDVLDGMLKREVNSPVASSCGRLFDAAAAACGIAREHAVYEGQGAVEFEAMVDEETLRNEDDLLAYPFSIPRLKDSNLPYIEPLAMWQALLGDLILKTPVPVIAARFHKGLAKAVVQMIEKLSAYETGDEPVRTAALSGGVWQNKVLFEEVVRRLKQKDFEVLTHREFPSNDGGLSLGQAAIAAAKSLTT